MKNSIFAFCVWVILSGTPQAQEAAPPPAQSDAVSATKEQLVFLRMPNGQTREIRAVSVETKGVFLTVVGEDGKTELFQANFLVCKAPAYTESVSQLKDEEIQAVLASYDKMILSKPALKRELAQERSKFQAVVQKRKEDAAAGLEKVKKAVEDFTAEAFKPELDYKADVLQARIEAGAKLKGRYPSEAGAIDAYLQPWIERRQVLSEGRMRFEGGWKTQDEIKAITTARKQEQIRSFLDTDPKIMMQAAAIPQSSVIMLAGFLALGLVSALYLLFHIVLAQRDGLGMSGFLALFMGIGLLIVYGYYGYRIYQGPDSIAEFAGLQALKTDGQTSMDVANRILFLAADGNTKYLNRDDLQVTLNAGELNAWLKARVRLEQAETPEKYGIRRTGMGVSILQDRIEFLDEVEFLGYPKLFRYVLHFSSGNNSIAFYQCDLTIGSARLPQQLSNYFWRMYQQQLWQALKKSGVPRIYQIEKIEKGKLVLAHI
ncbi:MAG: hypothetical protein PHD76_11140 [Methylacidiphilales bacterium]|nr:hypothetical protein [Candidatus Methylacidiphilales bacterium]